MAVKFSNNGSTTLSSAISASDTTIAVADGSVLPAISGSDHFFATIEDTDGNLEIVKVTALSSNSLTVTRAQESTTARAFASGSTLQNRLTAQGLNDAAQIPDAEFDSVSIPDNGSIYVGDSNDLRIYHSGSHSYIWDTGVGDLIIKASDQMKLQTASGERGLIINEDAAVQLYYNNSEKLKTATDGVQVTGTLQATGDGGSVYVRSLSAGGPATVKFSSDSGGSYAQQGNIKYYHADGDSYGSGNAFVVDGTESTMTFLVDGKLMYEEGIYSKPSSGTGAGTRKDANWDTAYGWGNHASAGYLTSYTETDPVFSAHAASGVTSTKISNWDTAYGWGDHASAGYLTGNQTITLSGDASGSGTSSINVTVNNSATADAWTTARSITLTGDVTGSAFWDGSVNLSLSTSVASSVLATKLSTSGGTMTGALSLSNGVEITNGPGTIAGATFNNGWFRLGTSSQGIAIDSNEMYTAGSGDFNFGALGSGKWKFTTRPRFTNGIDFGDSSPVVDENGNYLRITTSTGYTDIGSGNSTYSHFYTDRGQYYFNKQITVDTGVVSSFNEDLILRRSNSTVDRIQLADGYTDFGNQIRVKEGITDAGCRFKASQGQDLTLISTSSTGSSYLDIRVGDTLSTATTEFRFYHAGNFHADGNIYAYSTSINSDLRLKDNVADIENPLEKLDGIRGVTWNWKRDGKASAGVVAQEVEEVMPSAVLEGEDLNSDETYKSVDYNQIIGLLVASVKELKAEIERLKKGDD